MTATTVSLTVRIPPALRARLDVAAKARRQYGKPPIAELVIAALDAYLPAAAGVAKVAKVAKAARSGGRRG